MSFKLALMSQTKPSGPLSQPNEDEGTPSLHWPSLVSIQKVVNKKRRAIERAVRNALHSMLPPGMKYHILHHQSRSHYGLQMADYCCWAIFRKWQTGEKTWYDRIKPAVRRELELFRTKSKYYY